MLLDGEGDVDKEPVVERGLEDVPWIANIFRLRNLIRFVADVVGGGMVGQGKSGVRVGRALALEAKDQSDTAAAVSAYRVTAVSLV